MAILYQAAKFKSANILLFQIKGDLPSGQVLFLSLLLKARERLHAWVTMAAVVQESFLSFYRTSKNSALLIII